MIKKIKFSGDDHKVEGQYKKWNIWICYKYRKVWPILTKKFNIKRPYKSH